MNPRLVSCLIGSTVIALSAAVLAVTAGSGVIAGFLTYSFSGSTTLLASTLLIAWMEDRRPQPKVAAPSSAARA